MYSNKLVACVKANGKVLREKGEVVLLPFGSEYSLYFKNEHSRKVKIEVEIDGTDVLDGKALLLSAGETMDLYGYINDLHGQDNRAFKFITKTKAISDFRGDRAEDGLVKVSYTFEADKPVMSVTDFIQKHDICRSYTNCGPDYPKNGGFIDNINLGDFGISHTTLGNISNDSSYSTNSVTNGASFSTDTEMRSINLGDSGLAATNDSVTTQTIASDDPGITVEGSKTGQSFMIGSIGTLEDKSYTMVFQLKGLTSEEVVLEPVTVKTKKQCPSCGKKYKSSFEYCPQDGTFLR